MSSEIAKILDGKALSERMRQHMQKEIEAMNSRHGRAPGLAVILVGDDPASRVYVKNKKLACEKVGIISFSHELPADTTQQHILGLIGELNRDPRVDGILVQLPLPDHIDSETIIIAIDPGKDLKSHIERADIVVAAAGKQGLIQGEWIKKGAIVIDVGIHRLENGKLTGDVEFESAAKNASWITPVPGGVGPMTITMLLHNTIAAFRSHVGEQTVGDEV